MLGALRKSAGPKEPGSFRRSPKGLIPSGYGLHLEQEVRQRLALKSPYNKDHGVWGLYWGPPFMETTIWALFWLGVVFVWLYLGAQGPYHLLSNCTCQPVMSRIPLLTGPTSGF